MSIMADSGSIRHEIWRNASQELSSAQNVLGFCGFHLYLITKPGLLRHGRHGCVLKFPQNEAKASWKKPADHAPDAGAEPLPVS